MTEPAFNIDTLNIDFTESLKRQYVGVTTTAEAKGTVKKSFRMSRELEALADRLVQDKRTAYSAFEELVLHAMYELLLAYKMAGYPNADLGRQLEFERNIRERSYRSQQRSDIGDSFHRFDEELDQAVRLGDWKFIADHLQFRDKLIEDSPSESHAQQIRILSAQSLSVRKALRALLNWLDAGEAPQEIRGIVTRWTLALEDWGPAD